VQHPDWEFAAPVDQVNRWREEDKNPGQNVYDDYNCVLGFLSYAREFEERLGFVPPIICGEGGWEYGDLTDRRYPKVSDFLHQAHHMAMFAWFRDGVLPDGNALPEYLFAVCPWILSGSDEPAAWYDGSEGTRQQTIAAVTAMPRFTRDGATTQPSTPETPSEAVPEPSTEPGAETPTSAWSMSVQRQRRSDGVRAIAGSLPQPGVSLQVTDTWGNSVRVTSGSKGEYGAGGFEVPVWADSVYTLCFLDQTFEVEVDHELVIVTFSKNGSQDEGSEVVGTESRLVTDWMQLEKVEGLFRDLSRYEGVFSVETQ